MQATWRTVVRAGTLPLLLLFLRVSPASPATLQTLSVEGATVFTPREILSWLSSKPSALYIREALRNDCLSIRDRYRARGYLGTNASISSEQFSTDSSAVDVVLSIIEGKPTIVGSILLLGANVFSDSDLVSRFDTRPGDPLDQALLEQDIEEVLGRYEQRGLPLATCRVDSLTRKDGETVDTMDVTLTVEEGKRVTIDEIRVSGNKETSSDVVIRETRLAPGEPYNPTKVQAIRQRLVRLNIFSSVDEPRLFVRGEKGGLLINVREGSTNTFDGVLGYIPPGSDGRPGAVTGLVNVAMRNLFGTGRKLSVRWQREDKYSQELDLRYMEPWVASLPINAGAGFLQRQQDSSYVRRVLDLKAELMLSEALSLAIVGSSENVIPSSDSTVARVSQSSTRTIGAELLYDTRDELYSPTSGARYHVDFHYGRKKIEPTPGITAVGANVSVHRLGFDLESFFPSFSRQVVAVGIHGRDIQGGRVEEGEMFRFGGTLTLRGYREGQFLASRVVWVNNEYRFLMGRRTFFFAFVDAAYFVRPGDVLHAIPESDAFRAGYGIGIRLDTSLGNLGVSFAFGQGDTFSTAKVHFGIINDF